MIVLTRRTNESINIGSDITVTVVQAKNGRTKLSIKAPDHVRVLRSELPPIEQLRKELRPVREAKH